MKRTPWQRLTLSLLGILIIAASWRWSVAHLYSLPEYALTSFTSITTNAFYVIGSIVIFMVTGRLIYEWANRTSSQAISEAQNIKESITQTIRAPKTTSFDDGAPDLDHD
jgi:cation transport ATPase